jgi:hypothetical protein
MEAAIAVEDEGCKQHVHRLRHGAILLILLATAGIANSFDTTSGCLSSPTGSGRVTNSHVDQQAALRQVQLDIGTAIVILAQVVRLDPGGNVEQRSRLSK